MLSVFQYLWSILVGAAAACELHAVRRLALGGADALGGVRGVLGSIRARYPHALAMVTVISIITGFMGLCCCGWPGLIVSFLLYPTTYLVVAAEVPFSSAFAGGARLAVRNALVMVLFAVGSAVLFLSAALAILLVQLLLGLVLTIVTLSPMVEPIMQLLGTAVLDLLGVAVAYPVLAFSGGLLVSMATADRGVPLADI